MNLYTVPIDFVGDKELPEGRVVVPYELDLSVDISATIYTRSILSTRAKALSCIKSMYFTWNGTSATDALQVTIESTGQTLILPSTSGALPIYTRADDAFVFSKVSGVAGGTGSILLANFDVEPYLVSSLSSGGSGSGASGSFGNSVIPTGAINGINTIFTIPNQPNPPLTLSVYQNGVRLSQVQANPDYSLSGDTITFTNAPSIGDTLEAQYQY